MNQHLSLLDIHAMQGAVGPLIESNLDAAPVWGRLPVKRIIGRNYDAAIRLSYPSFEFTDVGQGSLVTASTYDHKTFVCHHLEAQLEVLESIAKAKQQQEGLELEDVWALEANGFFLQMMTDIDRQFFFGKASNVRGATKGFNGLINLVDAAMTFGAGGTGSTLTSAYMVFEDADSGVAFTMPRGDELTLSDWLFQQLLVSGNKADKNLRKTNGWSCGMTGFLGLKAEMPERAIARICNIDAAHPITDQLASFVRAKFKAGYKPTAIYMNDLAQAGLQKTRSATIVANGAKSTDGGEVQAPIPTTVAGIPIIITDSLTFTESEVSGANTATSVLLGNS